MTGLDPTIPIEQAASALSLVYSRLDLAAGHPLLFLSKTCHQVMHKCLAERYTDISQSNFPHMRWMTTFGNILSIHRDQLPPETAALSIDELMTGVIDQLSYLKRSVIFEMRIPEIFFSTFTPRELEVLIHFNPDINSFLTVMKNLLSEIELMKLLAKAFQAKTQSTAFNPSTKKQESEADRKVEIELSPEQQLAEKVLQLAFKSATTIFTQTVVKDTELDNETKDLLLSIFTREALPILATRGPAFLTQNLSLYQLQVLQKFLSSPLCESILDKTDRIAITIFEKRCEYENRNRAKILTALLKFISDKYSAMHEIVERLFVGSLKAAGHEDNPAARQTLQSRGIKHMICLCSERTPLFPEEITYHFIVVPDKATTNISQHFASTFELIEGALDANEGILVYCSKGMSRSATIAIAYLMRKYRYPYKKALEAVRSKRKIVKPNAGFVKQLKEYEKILLSDADNEKV